MCGILGARHDWLLQNGLDPAAAMHAAIARLRWRGPDGIGVVRIGDWWLGCARLAITQPGSSQPVVRRNGRHAAVMNGAITNARALWQRLLPRAERRPNPPNDAWLPLLAVERNDAAALAHLRGHHAYAVVDSSTGDLVFGQDRFGEKPMWLLLDGSFETGRLLAFASTPPALQALMMPAVPVQAQLGSLVRFGFADFQQQRVQGSLAVGRVPAGDTPWVAPAQGRCVPWRPRGAAPMPWSRVPDPPTLRERFFAGVARCMDTTQPVGLLLSGGLDSSCIASALHHAGHCPRAYQFMARGTDPAERAAARVVAAACNLPFHTVDGGPEVLDALPRLIELAGVPLGDPSILAVHAVACAAAADGVRILLGGEGADELFLGYRRYRALACMPNLRHFARLAPRWSMHYVARWLRAATSHDPAEVLLEVTPPAFRTEVIVAQSMATTPGGRTQTGSDAVLAAREADLRGYLPLDLLPKIDVATMAAGIECRCPWLEGDYAEFATTRAALGKRPLRAAFGKDLPTEVLALRKRGFSLPLDAWFRGDLPLLDLLAEPRTRGRAHLRAEGLAAAVDRHRRGAANLGHGLFVLASVELFLRQRET